MGKREGVPDLVGTKVSLTDTELAALRERIDATLRKLGRRFEGLRVTQGDEHVLVDIDSIDLELGETSALGPVGMPKLWNAIRGTVRDFMKGSP